MREGEKFRMYMNMGFDSALSLIDGVILMSSEKRHFLFTEFVVYSIAVWRL